MMNTNYRKCSKIRNSILLFIVLALTTVHIALAQDGGDPTPVPQRTVTDDEVNAVARQLYCPVCENVPLDVCPTQACSDWRAEIRTMLEQGKSTQDVLNYFKDRYGQRVLATPQARGFNLLVWILPPIAAIIGLGIVVLTLRRLAPKAESAAAASEPSLFRYDNLDPEYVARLESDLREMES